MVVKQILADLDKLKKDMTEAVCWPDPVKLETLDRVRKIVEKYLKAKP